MYVRIDKFSYRGVSVEKGRETKEVRSQSESEKEREKNCILKTGSGSELSKTTCAVFVARTDYSRKEDFPDDFVCIRIYVCMPGVL